MLKIIENVNPGLSLQLLLCKEKPKEVPLHDSLEITEEGVLFVDGFLKDFDKIDKSKCRIVFVAKDLPSALTISNFSVPKGWSDRIDVVLEEIEDVKRVGWSKVFSNMFFLGNLSLVRYWLDGIGMVVSDYRDYGKMILTNVFSNLLCTDKYYNGKSYGNMYKDIPILVCGSGPSLDCQKVRDVGDRCIVIACGTAILRFLEEGIKFHFGAYVDPLPDVDRYLKYPLDFPLFYQNRLSSNFFLHHYGKKIWMGLNKGWPLEEWIYDNCGMDKWFFDTGWNVGNFGVHIAKFLGSNQIVTTGIDGYPEDTSVDECKKDIFYGKKWIEQFGVLENVWDFVDRKVVVKFPNRSEVTDQSLVRRAILEISGENLLKPVNKFLDLLRRDIDYNSFVKEKVLLESELIGTINYDYLLMPMWNVFKRFMQDIGSGEEDRFVVMVLFFKQILEDGRYNGIYTKDDIFFFLWEKHGEVNIFGKNGLLFKENYICGLRDGKFVGYYEDGGKKVEMEYFRGKLNGQFLLFHNNGKLKRIGNYSMGKKYGKHRFFHDNGELFVECNFEDDKMVGVFKKYGVDGSLLEENKYLEDNKLEKTIFSKGTLFYKSKFEGDKFAETRFDGTTPHSRSGLWKEGKVVWD